jgi:hypothetical protein
MPDNNTYHNDTAADSQTSDETAWSGIEITRITKLSPEGQPAVISKKITLQPDNTLLTDGSLCQLQFGFAKRIPIADENALRALIGGLQSNQAITLGRLRSELGPEVRIASKAILDEVRKSYPDVFSRSNDYIEFTAERPGLGLLDADCKNRPDYINMRIEAAGGLWAVLEKVVPNLTQIQFVYRNSTSSGIFRTNCNPHVQMTNAGGFHFYLFVRNSTDFPRFLTALRDRLWLEGFGWYEISKGGQLLNLTVIDWSVGSPERLVFEAPPLLDGDLRQDPKQREIITHSGPQLVTEITQDLHPGEKSQLEALQAAAREHLKPALAQRRLTAEKERAHKNAKARGRSAPGLADWAAARRAGEGILLPNQVLAFDDPEFRGLTVRDVLNDPLRFIDATMADPLEGVYYGTGKAKIMVRDEDGSLFIHSFAHGRMIYDLKWDAETIEAIITALPKTEMLQQFLAMLPYADLNELDESLLIEQLVKLADVKIRVIQRAIKDARKKQTEAKDEAKRAWAAANRKDPRPQCRAPGEQEPTLALMAEMDRIMGAGRYPVMVASGGWPIRAAVDRPANTFKLMEDNADPDAPRAPAEPVTLLRRHNKWTLGLEIERRIDFVHNGRSVRLLDEYVQHYLHHDDGKLPFVKAVMTTPLVMRGNAGDPRPRLYMPENGVDRHLNVFFQISDDVRAAMPRPEDSTPEDAHAALLFLTEDWLGDVLTSFQGKCTLIVSVLQTLERTLLSERMAYLLTGGIRGVGKTTAVSMLALAATGSLPPASPWSDNPSERRKDMLAYLSEALAIIVRDNILNNSTISCPYLEASLTSSEFSDRMLGVNERRRVSAETTPYLTGNNIEAVGDLASRTLTTIFDADQPHPEERPFRHQDPYAWTLAHRADILRALYTLMLANSRSRSQQAPTRAKNWWRLCAAPVEHAANGLRPKDGKSPVRGGPGVEELPPDRGWVDFRELLQNHEDSGEALNADATFVAALRAITTTNKVGVVHDWFSAADVEMLVRGSALTDTPGKTAPSWAVQIFRDYTQPTTVKGENKSGVAVTSISIGLKLKGLAGRPFRIIETSTINRIKEIGTEGEDTKSTVEAGDEIAAIVLKLEKLPKRAAAKKHITGLYRVVAVKTPETN